MNTHDAIHLWIMIGFYLVGVVLFVGSLAFEWDKGFTDNGKIKTLRQEWDSFNFLGRFFLLIGGPLKCGMFAAALVFLGPPMALMCLIEDSKWNKQMGKWLGDLITRK